MLGLNLDDFKKPKSMKMSDYFKLVKPTYVYLKITPDTSIRNYNSATIAKTIQSLHKTVTNRIYKDAKVWLYECPSKVSFYIYIQKNDVEFYFIVPSKYEELMKEKISAVWGKAKIETVEDVPRFSSDSLKHEVVYAKEDALSLTLDKKCNEPLNSIFNVMDIMTEGDRVGIFYNFIPASQRTWRKEHERTIEKIRKNLPVDKDKLNPSYILKLTVNFIIDMLNELANTITEFLGGKTKESRTLAEVAITSLRLDDAKKLTKATVDKKDSTILNTQILVMSESNERANKHGNLISVTQSLNSIANDNEFVSRKVNVDFNPDERIITTRKFSVTRVIKKRELSTGSAVGINKMSTDECQNLLELAGKDLLSKYTSVKKIDVLENPVPKELREGYMSLGNVSYKTETQKAFLPSDHIYGNLPVTMLGGEGEGKTTQMVGKAYESWKNKEACVVIDYIKSCELSKEIMKLVPPEDVVVIDCSDNHKLPGLGFNEIVAKSNDVYDILEASSMRTEQFQALIDACNDEPLSDQMLKYFLAASNIVNLHPNMSLSRINKCLDDYVKRDEYIKYAESNEIFKEELEDDIQTLRELDEVKDGKVIGTKYNSIKFIQNRIIKLKSNRKLKLMYARSCDNNVNLVEAIENKKIIIIMLPQLHFGSPLSRNIAVTFFVSKLWAVAQIRGAMKDNPERVNIIIDELYQCPLAEKIIGDTLDQARKFGNRYIFSCHSFKQLKIAEQLKSEGSYIFFHNIDISDYNVFKALLEPYEYEHIKSMKQFHALCLIKYRGGYSKFVSHLQKLNK